MERNRTEQIPNSAGGIFSYWMNLLWITKKIYTETLSLESNAAMPNKSTHVCERESNLNRQSTNGLHFKTQPTIEMDCQQISDNQKSKRFDNK